MICDFHRFVFSLKFYDLVIVINSPKPDRILQQRALRLENNPG